MEYILIILTSIAVGFLLGYFCMKKKTGSKRYYELLDRYNEAVSHYNDLYRRYIIVNRTQNEK